MSAIPYNIARGAASSLQMSPPFAFSDVTMSVFPLRASLSRLETFCNNYLNQAPHLVQFKPFIPFVYLVILDYGRMSLQAANMGWVSQREVAFGIPLRWLNQTTDGAYFHDWAFTSPFIFVDNEMSMSTGREVYGWPKLLAKLDPSVSEWVRDPHGARRVFQVSTKRAEHAYTGEVQEYRPFLSIYQHRSAGMFDLPPSMETLTKPIQELSRTAAGMARLSGDLLRTFAGMASDGITNSPVLPNFMDKQTFQDQLKPERLKSWLNPRDWIPGMRDTLWSLFPRTYANTINFKQFRDAGDPHATCYQAITTARMPVKSVTQGGLLGPQNMMLGQLDGGFRIDVHSLAGLPIVESLGLEVAQERGSNGTVVSSLTPVCPLWMQVDMTYGLADTLVWRGRKDTWNAGELLTSLNAARAETKDKGGNPAAAATTSPPVTGDTPPPEPPKPEVPYGQEPDDSEDAFDLDYIRTMNFFNTARGATEAVGGEFTMPNASIRVLPIKACPEALNRFVSEYLYVHRKMRFEAWGDFVYLIICDFDQMNSTVNAVAKRRAREINLAVPVKCYEWFDDKQYRDYDQQDPELISEKAARHLITTGFVSAFSYVDDTGTAITASEVSGIPTMSSRIKSPANDWLNLDLSKDRVKRDILDMSAQVLPALMSGAQAQERSILQLHSHTPPKGKVHESQHESVNKWVSLLAEDLQRKNAQKEEADSLRIGQGFVLQLLGGDLALNQFSLKQFRDSRRTGEACYQGLVQRRHVIQKLVDLRELEEPLHVSITDYPTQPITEVLGLKAKFSYPGPDRIVRVFETLRPFSMTADLVREAGNTLYERLGSATWQRVDTVEQMFGWRATDRKSAIEAADNADTFDEEHPLGLRYVCQFPGARTLFRLHSKKVKKAFLDNRFRKHMEIGEVTELGIRDRYMSAPVCVAMAEKVLNGVCSDTSLDIAAYNAQVRQAGLEDRLAQARAASELARVDPATIADSVLSRQWGLAAGSKRRYHNKADFCVPAQTVPNQFTDVLFPTTERLYGYWPQTARHFGMEMSRRSAEVLSFRAELMTFVGTVGAFVGMHIHLSGRSEQAMKDIDLTIEDMRDTLTAAELPAFDRGRNRPADAKRDVAQIYADLFSTFANAMLPNVFEIEQGDARTGLVEHVQAGRMLAKAKDWAGVEAAVPRLMDMALQLFDGRNEYAEGIEEMSEIFLERIVRNRREMEIIEQNLQDNSSPEMFNLEQPDAVLRSRLTKLVTGEALSDVDSRSIDPRRKPAVAAGRHAIRTRNI